MSWLAGLHPDGEVTIVDGEPDLAEPRMSRGCHDPNGNWVLIIVGLTSRRAWIRDLSASYEEVRRLSAVGVTFE